MPRAIQFVDSGDTLEVREGGIVNLDGGSLDAAGEPLIPPPAGTPDLYVLTTNANEPGGVAWQATGAFEQTTITFEPPDVEESYTKTFGTITRGSLVMAAFLWVDTPSDAASSGTISLTGDDWSIFLLDNAPSADIYGGANPRVIQMLIGGPGVVSDDETVSLVWTPGDTPGVTAPVTRATMLTLPLF